MLVFHLKRRYAWLLRESCRIFSIICDSFIGNLLEAFLSPEQGKYSHNVRVIFSGNALRIHINLL